MKRIYGNKLSVKKINSNLYVKIKEIIDSSRNTAYRTVNFSMVMAYWNIGKVIVEDEQKGRKKAEYGKNTLKDLSEKLTSEFGKGFDERNIRFMRQFYIIFPNWNAVRSELSWSHYRSLLRVEDDDARDWYIKEAIECTWSSRQLDRQISTLYYERILGSKNKKIVKKEAIKKLSKVKTEDFIKDPYVLEFLNLKNYPDLMEKKLENALISNLQDFLLELGKGFTFVKRQKHIKFDNEDFYIDLVFYNIILKCYVLIDLKIGKLTHQDIGQMDSYIRMFDETERIEGDNPTIGIVLCSETNETIVKYSVLADKKQVYASKYNLALPKESVLKKQIEKARAQFERITESKNAI